MTHGITPLYYDFLRYLRTPEVSCRLQVLQLTGRIEHYLVKEFAFFVHRITSGRRFVYTNVGRAGERKADLAVMRFGSAGKPKVTGLIEAKYFRNRHRLSRSANGARDEDSATLKSLAAQLGLRPKKLLGKLDVQLASKTTKVYGLVFASYTRRDTEEDGRKDYYRGLLRRAAENGFVYHDLLQPYWRKIYNEQPVGGPPRRMEHYHRYIPRRTAHTCNVPRPILHENSWTESVGRRATLDPRLLN
jgi:hypothetical protein